MQTGVRAWNETQPEHYVIFFGANDAIRFDGLQGLHADPHAPRQVLQRYAVSLPHRLDLGARHSKARFNNVKFTHEILPRPANAEQAI